MIWGTNYHKFGQNIRIFKIVCTKYMAGSEAMTSSTHSFVSYSYWCFQKCFVKICETSKCHNFLIFQPIFIKFSLFCSKFFTLSSEIKLNLFRISLLNIHKFEWKIYCWSSSFTSTSLRNYCNAQIICHISSDDQTELKEMDR